MSARPRPRRPTRADFDSAHEYACRELDDHDRAAIRRWYASSTLLDTAARFGLSATRTARICRVRLDGTPRSPHADDGGW